MCVISHEYKSFYSLCFNINKLRLDSLNIASPTRQSRGLAK